MEEILFLSALCLVGVGIGWALVVRRWMNGFKIAIAVVIAGIVLMIILANQASGWEALGFIIIAVMGGGPVLVGLVIGGIIGHLKRPKNETDNGPTP